MGSATCVPDAPPLVREALRFRRTVQRPADLVATFRGSGVYLECASDPPAVSVVHVADAPCLPVFSDLRYFAEFRRRRGEGDRAEYLVLTGARLLDGYLPGLPQGTNVLLDPLQEHAVVLHGITPESLRATDGFTESARAMQRYRDVLSWAQRQAERAGATAPCPDPGTARDQARASIDSAKDRVEDAAKNLVKTLLLTAGKAPSQQYGETIGRLVSGALSAEKAFVRAGIGSFAEDPAGFVGQLAGGGLGHRVPAQRSDKRSSRGEKRGATPYPQGVPVTRQVLLLGDRPMPADARWWVDGGSVVLEIATAAHVFRSRGENLFDALLDIRLNQLEPDGLVLATAGSRYDVWSAPEGRFPGQHGSVHGSGESVDLLAAVGEADFHRIVLVRDQLAFHRRRG